MSAPSNAFAFDLDVARQAADRWYERQEKREHKLKNLANKQYLAIEPKERLAKRANRLIDAVSERLTVAPEAASPALKKIVARGHVTPEEVDNELMERVLGDTRDFLSIEFLERGLAANRSVGRVVTRLSAGRRSFGTGFMVTPRLLMTNCHVLPSAEDAAASCVEFNYQLDPTGQPLTVERFCLAPDEFFLNDKDLDYALVAVTPTSERGLELASLGHHPLIASEGKITVGEPVNIIQHPKGEMKQVVIRENGLLDLLEVFVQYKADTEPGSSGSPVFNDQWEIVALHHSSVPKRDAAGNMLDVNGGVWTERDDPALLCWIGNEGIRASRLVAGISSRKIPAAWRPLRDEFIALSKGISSIPLKKQDPIPKQDSTKEQSMSQGNGQTVAATPAISISNGEASPATPTAAAAVTLTIPVHITVTIGGASAASLPAAAIAPAELLEERVQPDEDYSNRPGYDPSFLGFEVPLPRLTNTIRGQAFKVDGKTGPAAYELKYYHYSLLFNKKRRLAFVSAVNIDAEPKFKHKREGKDRWFMDPRVPEDYQAGEELYAANPLDRGHLVRRDDAAWGANKAEARLANDDTFHFTNCSPQHEIFNQSGLASGQGLLLWGNLENHIAKQAKENNKKVCVFNGPIFRNNDRNYKGVQLPKEFFKVVVFQHDDGDPRALAFVLSQASLIKDLPEEEFEVGPYRPFQISISELENRTKMKFGALRDHDPLGSDEHERFFESDLDAVPIESLEDVIVGARSPRARVAPR